MNHIIEFSLEKEGTKKHIVLLIQHPILQHSYSLQLIQIPDLNLIIKSKWFDIYDSIHNIYEKNNTITYSFMRNNLLSHAPLTLKNYIRVEIIILIGSYEISAFND